MSQRYSVQEIRGSLPGGLDKTFWMSLWVRRVSFYTAWLFLRLGWSPNQVTYFSIVIGAVGCYAFAFEGMTGALVGAILFNVWLILDCTDGNMARVMKRASEYGDFVDAMGGYIVMAFAFWGAGLSVSLDPASTPPLFPREWYAHIGALASMGTVLARLIHQKFSNATLLSASTRPAGKKSKGMQQTIDLHVGLSGLFMPMALVCAYTNTMYVIPLFYAAYHSAGLLAVIALTIYKVERDPNSAVSGTE